MNLVAVLSVLASLAHSPQATDSLARDQINGSLGARLDSQLTRFAAYGFSGTVLVAREGRIVLLKGYGLADVERALANGAATRFEMNSMTKMFTGVAILQLVAQNRLRLTDPVARHLGGLPPEMQTATIEQLATHTSGLIVRGTELAGDSREAFIRDVAKGPLETQPGERYRYTNAGFSLLAAVIENASGERYEQYLRRHLFAPAGMDSVRFRNEVAADDPRCAHGYVGTPAAVVPGPPNPYVWGTIGAGGVWSTVGDIYRWVRALEEGSLLPEAQRQLLFAPPRPPAEESFGWHVHSAPDGRPRIDKGGGSDDFASQLLYYPAERLVIVWASNGLRQRWRRTLNRVLPAIALDHGPLSLPPVTPMRPEALDTLCGSFVSGRDTLALRAGAGYLYAAPNRLEVPTGVMFFPQDREHFTGFDPATESVTRLEFPGADGRSIAVTLANGRRLSATRPGPRK